MSTFLIKRPRDGTTGYLMIKSAEIKNFRCFEAVKLQDCRPINVVVGKNASGKTSLLEALFLAIGPSPEIATRYRNWRGYDPSMTGSLDDIEEAMWSDLFYRFDTDKQINVKLKGTDEHNRSLNISFTKSEPFVSIQDAAHPAALSLSAIQFTWIRHDQKKILVRPRFTGTGYQFPGTESPVVHASFFAGSHPFSNVETVKRFSRLSKTKAEAVVVNAFRKEFKFITGLDIQTHAGVSMIHASVKSLPRKIPLNLVSGGAHKFATLLLALAEREGGVIFVDEIENGFHYEILEGIWTAFHKICKDYNVQLFASTHSRECLEALASACKKVPNDVSLIRTELTDGAATVEHFKGSSAFAGMKMGEIR